MDDNMLQIQIANTLKVPSMDRRISTTLVVELLLNIAELLLRFADHNFCHPMEVMQHRSDNARSVSTLGLATPGAGRRASKQASKQQAFRQASKHASQPASKQMHFHSTAYRVVH